MERNLTAPSIATLEDILEALGSNLSEFFHEEEEKQIVFGVDDFFVDRERRLSGGMDHSECAEEPDGADPYDTLSA